MPRKIALIVLILSYVAQADCPMPVGVFVDRLDGETNRFTLQFFLNGDISLYSQDGAELLLEKKK